jgi:cytochrome c biogenesis protein CcmG/thiol:disulfide interchange protein DsbE
MSAVRAAVAAAVLALLGLLVWDVVHQNHGGVAAKVDKGQTVTAPAMQLPRLGAPGSFDLASYRGKVVVLNFWASWCVDCKLEAKTLATAAQRWRDRGVVFVGVDSQDLSGPARRYMARYHMDYPVVRDGDGNQGSQRWGVTGYPETFIVDASGRVVPPHVNGPIPAAQLNAAIRHALSS